MTCAFGPFRYDTEQRLLFRDGELLALAPKTLETLHVLLEQRGRVVEKAELIRLVWPDTHVEDVGLARNISLLRKALGDESDQNPIIETVPRRGYRFAAPVVVDDAVRSWRQPLPDGRGSEPEPRASASGSGTRRRLWIVLALAAVAMAALVYYQFYVPSRFVASGIRSASLAVVPFDCLCPGMDGDSFTRGLADVLVADMAGRPGLQLTAPSTVRRHQRMGVSMGLMGRLLGLDVLLEGTVQKFNDQLRTTARLVDVHTGKVVWAETYEERDDDQGGAETAVAQKIAAAVEQRLAGASR